MITYKDEPAAPSTDLFQDGSLNTQHLGFTAQEAAAIALRVPDSGNEWLDAMIRTAQRNEYAARADVPWDAVADAFQIAHGRRPIVKELLEHSAGIRFAVADAMLSGAATQIAEGE